MFSTFFFFFNWLEIVSISELGLVLQWVNRKCSYLYTLTLNIISCMNFHPEEPNRKIKEEQKYRDSGQKLNMTIIALGDESTGHSKTLSMGS